MAVRDRLVNVGRNLVGVTGDVLSGLAEDEGLWKAAGNRVSQDPENQEHAPGGSNQDTPVNAPVPEDKATQDPKTMFWDPFSVIEQLGFKDRPSNVTYGTLKAMTWKVPIIHSVIKTRIAQVATFASKPSQDRYDMGFKFHRRNDPKGELTPAEKKWAEQMTTVMMRTGVTDNPRGRDSFETFTKKCLRDSLMYDQLCFETVPNRIGLPAEWYAVDAATIRLADSASTYMDEDMDDAIRYVQIYDGMIITEYTQDQLCFGIRNPSTDIRLFGYGTSELEMLMNVITSLLWSWEYNQRAFSQGSAQKGILNFKGAVPDKQLKAFRRHWYQMLSGVENSWRTPITNADELQWIAMQQSNRDMEFNAWFDFLIKVACAMFDMDPVEVNFKYGNTGQKSAMADGNNKDKLNESRERGLRPLLRFWADCLNRHIIWPINENMELAFSGLDAQTKDEVATLNAKRVKTTHTVNELRAEENMDPIDGGDILLDPVYMQAQQMQQQQAAMEAGDFDMDGDVDEDDEDDFQNILKDEDEDGDEDKQTEGIGGRPAFGAKPAEAQKPQAGSVQKSQRRGKKKRRRSPLVDVQL